MQVALKAGRAGEAGVTRGAVAEGIRRLAEGAALAYAGTWLAAQGARARRLRAVG